MKKLPPFNLRVKVHGALDAKSFESVGQIIKNNLDEILLKISNGKKLENFEKVLEFGCGCGRVLLHIDQKIKSEFFGTDIDTKAISWCKKNIDFMNFRTNEKLPPLDFPENFFDIIYCISVFTHLDEKEQIKWLEELKRILKPKGFLLLSLHGFENLKNEKHIERAKKLGIMKNGFVFCKIKSPIKRIILGNSTTKLAYHTKHYVFETYSKIFKIVKYVDNGIANHQDLIVLQKD